MADLIIEHNNENKGHNCEKEGHTWDSCKCRRCGETRDEQHDWVESTWSWSSGSGGTYRRCDRCGAEEYD